MTASRIARLLTSLVLLAAAVALFLWTGVRQWEANASGLLVHWLVDPSAYTSTVKPVVFLNVDTRDMFGLEVTGACTVAYPMAGFLGLLALLAQVSRWSLGRLWIAVVGSSVVLVAVNQIRLLGVAWASKLWGLDVGYEISHRVVGTVITLIGLLLAVAVIFAVIGRDGRTKPVTA